MTYIPVDEHAEEYKQTGLWLMDRAESEFSQGDLVQASEKAWGAAAQFLKALATQRGWAHETHQHLGQVADRMADEMGNAEISNLFDRAGESTCQLLRSVQKRSVSTPGYGRDASLSGHPECRASARNSATQEPHEEANLPQNTSGGRELN